MHGGVHPSETTSFFILEVSWHTYTLSLPSLSVSPVFCFLYCPPSPTSLQGFLAWLLSGEGLPNMLLRKFIFHVTPMLNPDGVYLGNYRTNSLGTHRLLFLSCCNLSFILYLF